MNRNMEYQDQLDKYIKYLIEEEKSRATVEKYMRDVRLFLAYLGNREINKETVIDYKQKLVKTYAPASVNSMLVPLNGFLRFCNMPECCVKRLRIQRQIFQNEERELRKEEYQRLVKAAQGSRMELVLQTICGTGIRVSELIYITVEAVKSGKAVIRCKNKSRVVFIPRHLCTLLKKYIKKTRIRSGSIFITKSGKPLDRSNIWRSMKALCKKANVSSSKVFPHNLRHLFATTFYSLEKDIVRLSDLLGHSSIDTTRIYTMETGWKHRNSLERVQKILTT